MTQLTLTSWATTTALCIAFVSSCAAPSNSKSIRAEAGVLGEDAFAAASWESSNVSEAATESSAAVVVLVTDLDGTTDLTFTKFLETELNSLRRFPVLASTTSNASAEAVSLLAEYGQLNPQLDGDARPEDVVYTLEYEAIPKHMCWTSETLGALQAAQANLHEYWYEGIANLYRVSANGRREAIWGERNFRSRSQWVLEFVRSNGVHVRGHDVDDLEAKERLYARCRSSILFKLTKEVYSKLGRTAKVDGLLRSGDEVLASVPIGSKAGVLNGQPMFLTYQMGSLQVFLAKAIAISVDSETATFRIIEWNAPDARATEMASNPEAFLSTHSGKILARTEGLSAPPEWSERSAELERLMSFIEQDGQWLKELPSKERKALTAFVSSR